MDLVLQLVRYIPLDPSCFFGPIVFLWIHRRRISFGPWVNITYVTTWTWPFVSCPETVITG